MSASDTKATVSLPPRGTSPAEFAAGPLQPILRRLITFGRTYPVLSLIVIAAFSNILGSLFNIFYNLTFIVNRSLAPAQQTVFNQVALPIYNLIAYPMGLGITFWILRPIHRWHRQIVLGQNVPERELHRCRRVLVNVPFYQICVNFLCWLPGAVFFPAVITWLGGINEAGVIWGQFFISFVVAALLTVTQTFFWMEEFLIRVLYPLYFEGSRPADVHGTIRFSFFFRMMMFWAAVAFMPLFAIGVVAANLPRSELQSTLFLVVLGGWISGMLICTFVGRGLLRWLNHHQYGTDQISQRRFDYRIPEKRPDEWGHLTDRFNDMAHELEIAEKVRDTFGQFVHPDVRDSLLQRFPGLGGEIQEITVLFADIRGFTRRSAGQAPDKVVELLNLFLTLVVSVVENNGGWVNKFLGDGAMATFGYPRVRANHADLALGAAAELLQQLQNLNDQLRQRREPPLDVGIGIHTGQVLFGCVGGMVSQSEGQTMMRREFTAIGETVNVAQRLEQLTKTLAGPILISESTKRQLRGEAPMRCLGEHAIAGYEGSLRLYQILEANLERRE